MAGLGDVVAIYPPNPSPRPTLGARQITTPLAKAGYDPIQVDVRVTLANGATYSVTLDGPVVLDVQHDTEVNHITAFGSNGPVAKALGQTRVTMRLEGYARERTGVYEEPAIPEIPKFASPEDAQAWLDKNSA